MAKSGWSHRSKPDDHFATTQSQTNRAPLYAKLYVHI